VHVVSTAQDDQLSELVRKAQRNLVKHGLILLPTARTELEELFQPAVAQEEHALREEEFTKALDIRDT
jgi:hypothetical protein